MAIENLADNVSPNEVHQIGKQHKVILRLMAYLKPHLKALSLALTVLLLATAADVAGPVLVKIFIDQYLTPRIFEYRALLLLGGGYIVLVVLSALLHYQQLISFNRIALKIIQQLRVDVFSKVQQLGLTVFDTTATGTMVSRITNDTEAIKDLFVGVLSTFIQNFVFMIGIFIVMFALDARLATFCLVLLPLIFILMSVYRHFSTKVYRILRKELGLINAKLNESIQGMNIIQAMRQEKRFRQEFGAVNENLYQASLANIKLDSLLTRPAVDLLYTISLIMVLSFFGYKSFSGMVELGVLYAFINYLDRFFEPVNMIMMHLSQLQQAIVAAERVFELQDDRRTAPQTKAISSAQTTMTYASDQTTQKCSSNLQTNQALRLDKSLVIEHGLIEFKNVSFAYDGKNKVLDNVSFTVYPGQTVALVGHTGSGKSTISNLLMRFYPVTEGEILIDGRSLYIYPEEVLRKKIGLVAQDPFLFAGNIEQNIRLRRPNISNAKITEAARFVQADEFIRKMPKGYDETLGERGVTLSSGQRQLICFARTIAGNPTILILDEATASIDTETEELIQNALSKMRQGRSTLAIAHRLSTIQDADQILVLHRGRIVERGTHAELLTLGGLYYKLYLLQNSSA